MRSFLPSLLLSATALTIAVANQKVTYPEPFFLLDGDYESAAPVALLEEQNITTSADAAGFMKQKG
ncbi:hypothetical protein Gpo141_00009792, partial [Globisporangium polare]